MAAGLADPVAQMVRLGRVPAIHHDHLPAGSPQQVGIADGVLHRRNLHEGEMPRLLRAEQFLIPLAPGVPEILMKSLLSIMGYLRYRLKFNPRPITCSAGTPWKA